MESAYLFDVTSSGFEADVVRESMEVPILLEFWAEWCGPCKTFAPVLEKIVGEYAGAFRVGKVDTEAEPQLAGAFGVSTIPFAALVVKGQPVDAFSGAIGERELREFLAKAGVQPREVAEKDEPPDPDGAEARYAAALQALRTGSAAVAQERLSGINEEHELRRDADRILEGLPIFAARELVGTTSAEQALKRGAELLRSGQARLAVEEFLDSIAADKHHCDGLARRALLLCFLVVGEESEGGDEVSAWRRRLATLIY